MLEECVRWGRGGRHLQRRSFRPATVPGEDLHRAHRGAEGWGSDILVLYVLFGAFLSVQTCVPGITGSYKN